MDDITNLLALTFDEARIVAAIFERFFPNDASGPGAREIGAHQYLDRALAGAYADQLNVYRDGLEALNRISNEHHAHDFADCSESQQDALLSKMQAGTLENFVRPSQTAFFDLLLQHLREGLFSDPAYGGNRDKLGWKFLRFPGTYLENSAEENLSLEPVTKGDNILSLEDIKPQLAARKDAPIPGYDPQASARAPSADADIVLCGFGAVGTMIASIFTRAGLKVVALEAGPWRQQSEFVPDELGTGYWARAGMGAVKFNKEIPRWRKNPDEPTTDATFSLGKMVNAVGGSIMHYGAWLRRFHPHHYRMHSHILERYGKNALPEGCTLADWPISYAELEPYYERLEKLVGVAGDSAGNPFVPQRTPLPMPPMRPYQLGNLFTDTTRAMGLHPYPVPVGANSVPYDGRPAASYITWANGMGPIDPARWHPTHRLVPETLATGNLDLRTGCRVTKVLTNPDGSANGVAYVDANGLERVQKARHVILSSYTWENLRLLFLSGDAKRPNGLGNTGGQLGKHFMSKMMTDVRGYFPERNFNLHTGPCYQCAIVDDYLSADFNGLEHGFIGGATLSAENQAAPIGMSTAKLPDGVPAWGSQYKTHLKDWQRWGIVRIQPDNLPMQQNYVDIDPTHRDSSGLGMPKIRVTFDLRENEHRLAEYMEGKAEEVLEQMGATKTWRGNRFTGVGSSHDMGGARMGDDPNHSVVNRFLEVHDTPGLSVFGGAAFPSSPGINPTLAIWALTTWAADQLVEKLKR
jgi:gluconate 2-dehydrogenase alpha chain